MNSSNGNNGFWKNPILYKTTICDNWAAKKPCKWVRYFAISISNVHPFIRYGARCWYAHGFNELRYVPRLDQLPENVREALFVEPALARAFFQGMMHRDDLMYWCLPFRDDVIDRWWICLWIIISWVWISCFSRIDDVFFFFFRRRFVQTIHESHFRFWLVNHSVKESLIIVSHFNTIVIVIQSRFLLRWMRWRDRCTLLLWRPLRTSTIEEHLDGHQVWEITVIYCDYCRWLLIDVFLGSYSTVVYCRSSMDWWWRDSPCESSECKCSLRDYRIWHRTRCQVSCDLEGISTLRFSASSNDWSILFGLV